MTIFQKVADGITALVAVLCLVVPFFLPQWLLLTATFPEASLLQLVFAMLLVSAALILSGIGAIAMYILGWIYIGMFVIFSIWILLG